MDSDEAAKLMSNDPKILSGIITKMAEDAIRMQDDIERLRIDALRYRWLKENHLQLGPDCWIRTGDDLDEAIDAELTKGASDDTP